MSGLALSQRARSESVEVYNLVAYCLDGHLLKSHVRSGCEQEQGHDDAPFLHADAPDDVLASSETLDSLGYVPAAHAVGGELSSVISYLHVLAGAACHLNVVHTISAFHLGFDLTLHYLAYLLVGHGSMDLIGQDTLDVIVIATDSIDFASRERGIGHVLWQLVPHLAEQGGNLKFHRRDIDLLLELDSDAT